MDFRLFSLYKEISKSISSNKIYYKDWYIEKNKLVSKIDNLIFTKPTLTNVNDFRAVLIQP